ncbi:PilX N-terminal domain-containing pilus assembly protein [Dyella humi]|uniref:Pilus assembly protein PilX n=1 Tax=Dyella humi TaxID=1770547 RepID=A0ABW8IG72_9GAMM
MNITTKPRHRKDGGFVLIASLIMLIVLTFIAASLYHNFTVQQNMSANTKEKGRAFQMAQSTLQFAEYELLSNGLNAALATCISAPAAGVFEICPTNTSGNPVGPTSGSPMTISNAMTYNATTADSNIQFSTTGGAGLYYAQPMYYIRYLGYDPRSSCKAKIFEVTALAYGGTSGTTAVVRSDYELTPTVCNLGNP